MLRCDKEKEEKEQVKKIVNIITIKCMRNPFNLITDYKTVCDSFA